MGMTAAEMDEVHQAAQEAFETFWDEDMESSPEGEPDDGPYQDDLFGFDDIDMSQQAAEDEFNENEPGSFFEGKAPDHRRTKLMDDNWIKSLFRRAAQALHPDREQDAEIRTLKQHKMRELLEARKQGDIMTLMALYSENVDGGDILVAEREMALVCELLEEQIEGLNLEKLEYAYSHPLRMMVYQQFYAPSKKSRERKIQEWKKELQKDADLNRELLAYLRNLPHLKEVLRDRRDLRFLDALAFGL